MNKKAIYFFPLIAGSLVLSYVVEFIRLLLQKFFYEPMFKTRCECCGKNLKIDIKAPQVSKNLKIKIGNSVIINGVNSFFATDVYKNPKLIIGDSCYIGFQVSISVAQHVFLGDNCLIAARVSIMDNNNHPLDPVKRKRMGKVPESEISPIYIEENVWLGYQAFIGRGVRIGRGSIIAANSVVLRDIPPFSIAAGNPAKVVAKLG